MCELTVVELLCRIVLVDINLTATLGPGEVLHETACQRYPSR